MGVTDFLHSVDDMRKGFLLAKRTITLARRVDVCIIVFTSDNATIPTN